MKNNIDIILDELEQLYPEADCELDYGTPFQLLISVVLSAQTTDKMVNDVTKDLFKEYPDLEAMLTLSEIELQQKIKKIGLYRNKSKSIHKLCIMLAEEFDGKVPDEYDDLIRLPGVGRKTANVVLSNAFSKPAIAVDTHVFRVSNRIGLAEAKDVLKTELQLMELIPKERWSLAHHLLIWHGRRTCKAKKPSCDTCPISQCCKYFLGIEEEQS